MNRLAVFSEDRKYRYQLSIEWDYTLPKAMCIGLNPSTANEVDNDPTISRLVGILKHNGYGGFIMTNLFGLVSPYPEDLRTCPDPVKENDRWMADARSQCRDVIFCWGNFKQAKYRESLIKVRYTDALCFGINKNGSPKHPLYLKQDTLTRPYLVMRPKK